MKISAIACLFLTCLSLSLSCAQSPIPENVKTILNGPLEEGQKNLQNKGYEVVYSSSFGKRQYWWNEPSKTCLSLGFRGEMIKELSTIHMDECQSRLEAARAIRDVYRTGLSEISSPSLEAQRNTLSSQGYVPSYWIRETAPGRSREYWHKKEGESKCFSIMSNIHDGSIIRAEACPLKECELPEIK